MKKIKYEFWLIVHHLISHPLLIIDAKWCWNFHDFTASKMEENQIS